MIGCPADGPAAQVNAAFNTSLEQFQQNGLTVFANTKPAQVPASLNGIAVAVLGLNNAAVMKTPVRRADTIPTYPFASYYPQDMWKAYDVGKTPAGSSTPIAVFAEGDVTSVVNDFKTSRQLLGLPVPPVTVMNAGIPQSRYLRQYRMESGYAGIRRHGGQRKPALPVRRIFIYGYRPDLHLQQIRRPEISKGRQRFFWFFAKSFLLSTAICWLMTTFFWRRQPRDKTCSSPRRYRLVLRCCGGHKRRSRRRTFRGSTCCVHLCRRRRWHLIVHEC
jgi:hypothetical protein